MSKLVQKINAGDFSSVHINNINDFYIEFKAIVGLYNDDGFGMACVNDDTNEIASYHQLNTWDDLNLNGEIKINSAYDFPCFDNVGSTYKSHLVEAFQSPTMLIAHSRTSTNDISLDHVHPFISEDKQNAFIHNGVIKSPDAECFIDTDDLKTNNDSELLSELYWTLGTDVTQVVTGYMATMNLGYDIDGNGQIEIIRDDTAELYSFYCGALETYIIGTTENMICDLMDVLGYLVKKSDIVPIKDLVSFKIDSMGILDCSVVSALADCSLSAKEELAFKDYAPKSVGTANKKSVKKYMYDNYDSEEYDAWKYAK